MSKQELPKDFGNDDISKALASAAAAVQLLRRQQSDTERLRAATLVFRHSGDLKHLAWSILGSMRLRRVWERRMKTKLFKRPMGGRR